MPKAIAITDAAPKGAVEVDLWGTIFNAVPITRTRQAEMERLQAAIYNLNESTPDAADKLVELIAQTIDVHVEPAGTRRKKASDFILERWNKDELTTEQLLLFQQRLNEAVRPT